MRTEEPRPVRLKDYRPPDWLIETVDLDVSLDPTATTVRAKLRVKPNGAGASCVCSPPPRDKATQEVQWTALAGGTFTIVSSDHSLFNMTGTRGKFVNGRDAPFSKIPNGVLGVCRC